MIVIILADLAAAYCIGYMMWLERDMGWKHPSFFIRLFFVLVFIYLAYKLITI